MNIILKDTQKDINRLSALSKSEIDKAKKMFEKVNKNKNKEESIELKLE